MSPEKDAQLSQRTEGKTRDKINPKTVNNVKKTDKKAEVVKPKVAEAPEVEEKESEPRPKKLVPYVDLPPKRVTALTEPVKEEMPKLGPSYKNRAPVEIGLDIEKLVESVLDMEINVPLRSLAGVSSVIQKEIRKQVTKARLPVDEKTEKVNLIREKIKVEDLPLANHVLMQDVSEEIPQGYFVASDPVLQYLAENKGVELPTLIVGKSTEPLRAVYATINSVGQEECLIDGGSMLVSMAKKVAIQLGLTWDPSLRIEMESASNHTEQTLGMARNTCFTIGGLKFFLQVHIFENPPYRVLLGKPFETLARTVIQTYEDGSSEVVLTDPNTKRIAVVPTYKRGESPDELQKSKFQGF